MSSIHAQRAKRWGTTPFIAEWLAKAVEFCHRTSEGNLEFQSWAQRHFGKEEGREKIESCQKPPQKRYYYGHGDAMLSNSAGVELGVCEEAMILYHQFASEMNLCLPEPTKPAPKRRRGESAHEWIARRHSSLMDGCKRANVDWDIARAIAISEFDKVCDNIRGWRTDPDMFFEAISSRAFCLICPPELEEDPYRAPYMMHDAFAWSIISLTVSHLVWSYAADLFQDLTRRNLRTSSTIERAYKEDAHLLWRFASCHALVEYEHHRHCCSIRLQLSVSPYYCPYFKRTHSRDGVAKIEINKEYLASQPLDSPLDDLVLQTVISQICWTRGQASSFFESFVKYLSDKPSDAQKFSAAAYRAIGDFANVHEFTVNLFGSPFGVAMGRYANSIKNYQDQPDFAPDKCFADPSKTTVSFLTSRNLWSDAQAVNTRICRTWVQANEGITVFQPLYDTITSILSGPFSPTSFDEMWTKADQALWKVAQSLDRAGKQDLVAKQFGLVDPNDPNRPSFTRNPFQVHEGSEGSYPQDTMVVPPTPPQPFAENIPAATAVDSVAKSGHAFISETKGCKLKEKVKTRGTAAPIQEEKPGCCDDDDQLQEFPDILPMEFKLGKKLMKVFHRILTDDAELSGDFKKGQLRWGDFERAMKRIGFDVVQTAGSSVRFDPPARMARPITFHRPHPDSTMTPPLIKWVGARLKRCYGWKYSTFLQGAQTDN